MRILLYVCLLPSSAASPGRYAATASLCCSTVVAIAQINPSNSLPTATTVDTVNTTLPDTVPIAAYRNGDFSNLITAENRLVTTASGPYVDPLGRTIQSGTIFNPADFTIVNGQTVRNPFPGNKIPITSFDPVAAKILALVPNPLGPNANQAGSNYLAGFDKGRVSNIPSFKFDQTLGSKLHRRSICSGPTPVRPGPSRRPMTCRTTSPDRPFRRMPRGPCASTWTTP